MSRVAADWEGMWAAGLKPGDRFDLSRSHFLLQKVRRDVCAVV